MLGGTSIINFKDYAHLKPYPRICDEIFNNCLGFYQLNQFFFIFMIPFRNYEAQSLVYVREYCPARNNAIVIVV